MGNLLVFCKIKMSSHDNTQIMNIKGATSVKYSGQMPGGNTSISLGGGYGGEDDRFGGSGKVGGAAATAAPAKDEEEKQEEAAGTASNAFTSVKYSGQPPGGKSNFTLG